MWVICLEGYNRIFEDKSLCEELFERGKYLLALWAVTDKEFIDSILSLLELDWITIVGF